MHTSSSTARRLATLGSAIPLAMLLALPVATAGAEPAVAEQADPQAGEDAESAEDTEDAESAEDGDEQQADDQRSGADDDRASDDDGAREPAPAEDGDCEPFVTHTPEGSTGDQWAVAITSQAREEGVAGWTHVGWEAAEDTTVDEVHVVRDEATERFVDGDLRTGHAEDVLELRFCGRAVPRDASAGDDPSEDGGEDAAAGARGDDTGDEHDEAHPDGEPRDAGEDTGDGAGLDEEEAPATGEGQTTGSDGAPDAGADVSDEVEVLGVQQTADDAEAADSPLPRTGVGITILATIAAAGLPIAAFALRRHRRAAST